VEHYGYNLVPDLKLGSPLVGLGKPDSPVLPILVRWLSSANSLRRD
jgi:hypothetical protein